MAMFHARMNIQKKSEIQRVVQKQRFCNWTVMNTVKNKEPFDVVQGSSKRRSEIGNAALTEAPSR